MGKPGKKQYPSVMQHEMGSNSVFGGGLVCGAYVRYSVAGKALKLLHSEESKLFLA